MPYYQVTPDNIAIVENWIELAYKHLTHSENKIRELSLDLLIEFSTKT